MKQQFFKRSVQFHEQTDLIVSLQFGKISLEIILINSTHLSLMDFNLMQIIYFYSFFVNYYHLVIQLYPSCTSFYSYTLSSSSMFLFDSLYPIHNRLQFHEQLSLPHNPHNLSMTCLNDLLLVSRQLSLNTAIFYHVSILFFNIVCIIAIVDLLLSYNQHFWLSFLPLFLDCYFLFSNGIYFFRYTPVVLTAQERTLGFQEILKTLYVDLFQSNCCNVFE